MGVKGLATFINDACPHVKHKISILQLAHRHRHCHSVTPELVIDGMALVYALYCGKLDWIYGGQWSEYITLLKTFVGFFVKGGVKPIFFFDGGIIEPKRNEWVNRRLEKCREIADMFSMLRNHNCEGSELSRINERHQLPTSLASLSSLAIKLLFPDVEVHVSVDDCDVEIASYAQHTKAVFAILSNDTDFIIFDSKVYLSLENMNFRTMEAFCFDRTTLSQFLNLPQEKLPLLACLAGNDFVSKELLRKFHNNLYRTMNRNVRLHTFLANLIQKKNWSGNYENRNELSKISYEICGDNGMMEMLHHSMKMYVDLQSLPQPSNIVEWRHRNCVNSPLVYNVYVDQNISCSEVMEDTMDQTLPPVNLVFRPIRQRVYSILLNQKDENSHLGTNNTAVKEWCVYFGNDLKNPDLVPTLPLKISASIPCLETLWDDAPSSVKLQCFMGCLDIPLTVGQILNVEPKYAIFCCIMNYLMIYHPPPLMNKFEVRAFIAQAVCLQYKSPHHIHNISVPFTETRAIYFTSLFMRGIIAIIFALGASGYPFKCIDAMPWNFFDGKLFHKKYRDAKHGAPNEYLCEQKVESINLFNKLFSMIIFGTGISDQKLTG